MMKVRVNFCMISILVCMVSLAYSEHAGASGKGNNLTYSPEWGSRTVSCAHTPTIDEYFRTYTPHRLTFQSAWLVANVMDESNRKYNLLRKYETAGTAMTLASVEVQGIHSKAEQLFKPGDMFLGRIYQEMDQERGLILVKPFSPGGAAFTITIRPQHIHWSDADERINLTFKAMGPALQYFVPGRLEDAMYRSEPHWVEGTVNGKKVSGFGVFDFAWGPAGVGFVQGKIYKLLEESWIVWANEFADGSRECGIFVEGVDEFNAYYYNQNGKALVTRKNKMDLNFYDDGFVKGAHITMDDLEFEFTSESRILQVPTTLVSWASGRVINTKDSRKPVKSFAWFEYFPKGRSGLFGENRE
jgi:hypothetical protein